MADPPPVAAPARGGSWRPILLLVIVAPLLLGLVMVLRSGGGLTPAAGLDWSPYPPSVRAAVDRASKNLDCAGLAEQRAWAVGPSASGVDTAPLVAYIDEIQRQLVCPR